MGKEKRAHPRANIYHLAKYNLMLDPSSRKGPANLTSIRNISGGGVCLQVTENPFRHSLIQLYINFPYIRQPIPALAQIKWAKRLKGSRYEVGVQFLDIEELLRREIIKRVDFLKGLKKKDAGKGLLKLKKVLAFR
jgi:c-di-GMP-binding flagellar brake protein YcgR